MVRMKRQGKPSSKGANGGAEPRLRLSGESSSAGEDEAAARALLSAAPAATLPGEPLNLLGVQYRHLTTAEGGELYLTEYGWPFWEHLRPENWHVKEWFEEKRTRLVGTGTVYHVPTREIRGAALQLVVKWSRVGEEVPLDTFTVAKFIQAEFNSPFEEFALLMQLRSGEYGPAELRIRCQKPLAIFVPPVRLQFWQTGRSKAKIAVKVAQHPGVELDILRQYVLLYGWIRGLDAVQAAGVLRLEGALREAFLSGHADRATEQLQAKGFRMADMKPEHIILRLRPDGSLLKDRRGRPVYALVDYELLERTPEHEQAVRAVNRERYLKGMARRFEMRPVPFPPHLRPTQVLGVNYVFGHTESTGGRLWVVGRDPELFNYFLPERWRRTPRTKLSAGKLIFYTKTKDNIHLVYRISRVGERPAAAHLASLAAEDGEQVDAEAVRAFGYNSPFEEFAFALQLARRGVPAVYPRAIYMTGDSGPPPQDEDPSRYESHRGLLTPDAQPVLRQGYDYLTVWGYWNGPDEALALRDAAHYQGISARRAFQNNLLAQTQLRELLAEQQRLLRGAGFRHLALRPDHLLLAFDSSGNLVRDSSGRLDVRLCSFSLLRPAVEPSAPGP